MLEQTKGIQLTRSKDHNTMTRETIEKYNMRDQRNIIQYDVPKEHNTVRYTKGT